MGNDLKKGAKSPNKKNVKEINKSNISINNSPINQNKSKIIVDNIQ